jgi:threonine dehydrogenase-like Zn-dependent dehydrogenase
VTVPSSAVPSSAVPSSAVPALIVRGPGDVRLEGREPLHPGPGELLVRPDLVGLCGTDLEIIDGTIDPAYLRYPVALGHEWTGIVAGDSPLAGRRVIVAGIIGCGQCVRCAAGEANLCEIYDEIGFTRDGAAAGQIVVPASQVHPLAAGVSAQDAVLAEPAAVVYQALTKARIVPGSRVLVLGDGTIALLAVLLLRLWSPAQIAVLGLRGEQAGLAAAAGATSFGLADSEAGGPADDAGPEGFDLVVEAAGAVAAVQLAVTRVRRGGTVLLIGLPPHGDTVPLAADDIVNNDLTIAGSFGYTPAAWRGVLTLLNSGQLRPGILVTHRYPLADWEQAIGTLRGSSGPAGPRGKVLLEIRTHPGP